MPGSPDRDAKQSPRVLESYRTVREVMEDEFLNPEEDLFWRQWQATTGLAEIAEAR